MKMFRVSLVAACAAALAACGGGGTGGGTRDTVRAVGSSTVYPFATTVAEIFGRGSPEFGSPIIEATGSGGGIQLFCQGLGANTPDIVNSSRRLKRAEFDNCVANGVTEITEIQVGMDGLAFASAQGGIMLNLTPEIVYRALAANPFGQPQTARTWADVDPSLPGIPILVYGPPSTSGTRDSLKELVLEVGCDTNADMRALKDSDPGQHERVCGEVRSDGVYVDSGEQDNLIVQRIQNNPNAVGVFGFSYLEENLDRVQGLPMNGVAPTVENVSSFAYPGARAMFIYVKKPHLDVIRGLREYVAAWAQNWGPDGPLARIGLIVSAPDVAAQAARAASEFPTLMAEDLD